MQGSGEVVHDRGSIARDAQRGPRGPFGQRRNGANLGRPYGFAERGLSKAAIVDLPARYSNRAELLRPLAEVLNVARSFLREW
jgi:hypothetical protein